MNIVGINQVAKYAMHNRGFLELSQHMGCYHCLKMTSLDEIKDWTDGGRTAICPYCSVDSILGDSCGYAITKESLESARDYWFGKPNSPSGE